MKCHLCERYSTTDKSNFKRHQLICMDRLYCDHCKFHTKDRNMMERHMIKHFPRCEIYKCNRCDSYKSKRSLNLKRHQKVCMIKLSCSHCDFTTNSKLKLIHHMRKHVKTLDNFTCKFCTFKTLNIHHLYKHETLCRRKLKNCENCDFTTNSTKELRAHLRKTNHNAVLCNVCNRYFINKYYYKQHKYGCSIRKQNSSNNLEIQEAVKGAFKILKFSNFKMKNDFKQTLYLEMKEILRQHIEEEAVKSQNGIKWNISAQVSLYKPSPDESVEEDSWAHPIFKSSIQKTLKSSEEIISLEPIFEKLNDKCELYCSLGSGWVFGEVLTIFLEIAQYDPLGGSSWIFTPKKLRQKSLQKTILNIENKNDEYCFIYCILAKINQVYDVNPDTYTKYKSQIDVSGLIFPMEVRQINMFEKNNKDISVSVFGYENEHIFPLRISCSKERKHHIDLLLITEEETAHYILILDKNKLFRHILYPKSHHDKIYICDYCLNRCYRKESFNEHVARCELEKPQATKYPTNDNNILKFHNYHKMLKRPVTIYADFETMNINGNLIPSSFAYVIVDDTHSPITFREFRNSENVVHAFLSSIIKDVDTIKKTRKDYKDIIWTDEDKIIYDQATHCHICEEPFDLTIIDPNHPLSRVADHYHFEFSHTKPSSSNKPGRLRGAAHRQCNAGFHTKFRVPVIFHNLKKFDGHLIIKECKSFIKDPKDFHCIAQTIEKYSSFSFRGLDFIDSLEFLSSSLESLVSTLKSDQMKILKHYFPHEEDFQLLSRKGVFPYEYITSYEKLNERHLPSIQAFYSHLSESSISESDYNHAHKVWNRFNCSTLGEYQDLYNKTDVLLLADIFENFRSSMIQYYSLDPCNYISFPGLAWDAMLKMTKVNLELITDPNIYLMIEQGIRGGMAVIPTRYAKAIPNESSLLYVDCNNLYGSAMQQYLPVNGFKFVSIDINSVLATPTDSDVGYICEVDIMVPDNLHTYFQDFPLAPCKQKVREDQLSPYQKDLLKKLNTSYTPTEKLLTTLEPKTNYIVHYENLKLYVKLGLVITKVHKIIQFFQSPWMKPFIDFNTQKRAQANTKFEQNLMKLASNSCFGRTLMNVKKHKNFLLITNEMRAKAYIRKPTFQQFAIFDEDLVGILFSKTVVTLNKPIQVGMVILELSKYIMYDYYYNTLKTNFGDKMKLCMTDTDSLLVHLNIPDLERAMMTIQHSLDTSNFPADHPLYSEKRKKIAGYFSNEVPPPDKIVKFIGLRAKMYSFQTENTHNKNVGKGIPRHSLKKISLTDYENALFNESTSRVSFNQILSKNHSIQIKSQTKIALSPFDDKRYLLPDRISTLPYGHIDTRNIDNKMQVE